MACHERANEVSESSGGGGGSRSAANLRFSNNSGTSKRSTRQKRQKALVQVQNRYSEPAPSDRPGACVRKGGLYPHGIATASPFKLKPETADQSRPRKIGAGCPSSYSIEPFCSHLRPSGLQILARILRYAALISTVADAA